VRLLLCDDGVAVFDKPSGLLTHASAMAREEDTALTQARHALGTYVWPLHRLDRATSGVLAFALERERSMTLSRAFEEGRVSKSYLAIVRGTAPEHVVVDHAIPKTEGGERVSAVTQIDRVAIGDRVSLVVAQPRTGRFHQIRRHLKHLGHPIACDSNYGTGWFNRWMRDEVGLSRLALHASSLELPRSDQGRIAVRAPLPDDLIRALRRLGIDPSAIEAG